MFDKRLLLVPTDWNTNQTGILHDDITWLLEEFTDKGPENLRFVRVRSWSTGFFRSDPHEQPPEGRFSYGPLVRAERINEEELSLGARLLDAAYRLKRTGPELPPQRLPR